MTKRVRGRPSLYVYALGVYALGVGACGKTRAPENSHNSAGSSGFEAGAGRGGAGGTSATSTAGSAGVPVTNTGGTSGRCFNDAVVCLDPLTAQYCDVGQTFASVDCNLGMATEGFLSFGCESNAEGDGCTIDGLLDPDCQAGTPNFTACLGGSVDDLLDVYAACFTDFEGAKAIVSCYADFMDETDKLVDCSAAYAACSRP